jgi:glycine betaine catabolism B
LLARAVPGIAARRVHICGPTEMTDATRQTLLDLGVPDDAIRIESFASPSRTVANDQPVSAATTSSPAASDDYEGETTLTFARSGKSAVVAASQTVLEAAEALGVSINYDCRAGICGQCKIKLLAGRVVMDAEDALEPADRANDVILSCQARCVDQVVVEA